MLLPVLLWLPVCNPDLDPCMPTPWLTDGLPACRTCAHVNACRSFGSCFDLDLQARAATSVARASRSQAESTSLTHSLNGAFVGANLLTTRTFGA
jgi:hypothetical protein